MNIFAYFFKKFFKRKIIIRFIIFLVLLINLWNCSVAFYRPNQIIAEEFNYETIARFYFNPFKEEPYPLTVRRGINTFGVTSKDGRFLFLASDGGGNFDIVFRDLKTSTVVPITKHPANETKPAISPDGKRLVYVSEQYDSDGDLMLVTIEPEEWLEAYLRGERYATKDRSIVLTNKNYRDPAKIERAVDTDPAWSPDGKFIAYATSSFTSGMTNIAIIDVEKNFAIRQLTKAGGASPVFSYDGKKIYYLSYKDNSQGEIYELSIESGEERRITNDKFQNYSPSVSSDGKYLLYISIQRDTNKNGKLDTRDNSVIVRYDLKTGKSVNLSAGNFPLFDCKYSSLIGGSVIFTASVDNALNIFFIPIDGEIPKQKNIGDQYEISKQYRKRSADFARLAFDSIFLHYGDDPLYPIYQSKADNQMVMEYESEGRLQESEELIQKMLSSKNDPKFGLSYSYAISHIERKKGKLPDAQILSYYEEMKHAKGVHPDLPPSILSTLAAAYAFRGDFVRSNEMNEKILFDYPNFFEKTDLSRYIASVKFEKDRSKIPPAYISILESPESNRLENKYILDDVLSDFRKMDNSQKRIELSDHLLQVQKEELQKNPEMIGALKYNQAEALNDLDRFQESTELIESYIHTLRKGSYIYLSSLLLESENFRETGEVEKGQSRLLEFIKNYNFESGIEVDSLKIEALLEYYETRARVYEIENKLKEAALTYQANNEFLALAHTRRLPIRKMLRRYTNFYQKKYVDTVLKLARTVVEENEKKLLSQINLVDQLDVQGRLTETLAFFFRWSSFRFFGDFRDLQYLNYLDSESLELADKYFENSLEEAKNSLDLGVIYGYAYYLISRSVLEEGFYKRENNLTYARKKKILGKLKQAEYELLRIIYSDSNNVDAYLLLGWLYQYIEVHKIQETFPEFEKEQDVYYNAYIQTFPRKYLEENVDIYTQLIEFLGKKANPKSLSDINLNLANNYFLLNNYQKALHHYETVDKLSYAIIENTRFENYKQKALFYFNFARSKVYNGKIDDAVPLLNKSLKIYYSNEYYPNVSKAGTKNSRRLQKELTETRQKLALLHALIGLVEMEQEKYKDATLSFSMALSMNGNTEFINDISLYNSIAICFQKIGDYKKSEFYLRQADKVYKSKKELVDFFDFSLWDVIIPDSQQVIGEGRFPSEMPLEFSNLLTQGIRIKNNLDLHEHNEVEKQIAKRDKFIKSEKLQKFVIGEELLHRSRNDLAHNQFIRGKYFEAAELYKKDFEHWEELGNDEKAFQAFQRQSISLFSHIEENSDDKEKLYVELLEELKEINFIKEQEMKHCLPKFNLLSKDKFTEECDKEFFFKRPDYDVILGYIYYYLAEIDYNRNFLEEAFQYYGTALKLLKNPSGISDSEIGLEGDRLSKKERARLKIAVAIINLRLGELKEFERGIQEAYYFSGEFGFEMEQSTTLILKAEYSFKYGKTKNDFLSAVRYIEEAEKILRSSPGTFYDINEVFINYLYSIKTESLIHADRFEELSACREKLYSAIFFRQLLVNELKFQDPYIFSILNELQYLVAEDDEYSDKIEVGLLKGVNISKLLQAKGKNFQKFLKRLHDLEKSLPNGMDILSWFGRRRDYTPKPKSDEIVIELFKNMDRYVQVAHYNGKREFFRYDVKDGDPMQELEAGFLKILKDKPDVKSIVLIPSPKMSLINFNKLKFEDSTLNEKYSIRYLFRTSQLERESNQGFTRLRRITSLDTRPVLERGIVDRILFNPLELIIQPVVIEEEKLKELNLRVIPSQDLKGFLTDTDILEGPTDFINRKQYIGEKREGFISIKELVENQWDVPVIVLNNYFRSQDSVLKMGFLYDVLQFSGTQSIVLIESNQDSEKIRNKLLSNIKNANSILQEEKLMLIGEKITQYPEDQRKYREEFEKYTAEGVSEERKQKFLPAMKKFLLANSILPDNDPETQIRAELNIERIKTYLFTENNYFEHYDLVLSKFAGIPEKRERILYDLLLVCYESKENLDCKKYYKEYQSLKPPEKRLVTVDFYKNLRENNLEYVDANYKNFLEKSEKNDEFLFHYKLSYLFARSFYWEWAEFHLQEALKKAATEEEKKLVQEKLGDLEFEKFFIRGLLPDKNHNDKLYTFAITRKWDKYKRSLEEINFIDDNYYAKNYREKIFDAFQKLESSSDFEPLALGPIYMKDGRPSIVLLNETERGFLFYIFLRSISYQRGEELNNQLDILLKAELDLGNKNRFLWMSIAWASALYYRGDIVNSKKYLSSFENEFTYQDQNLLTPYRVLKFKIAKNDSTVEISEEEKQAIVQKEEWLRYYEAVDKSTSTENFANIISDVLRNTKGFFDFYKQREFSDLLVYMARIALEKKDYFTLFNVLTYKERIAAYNDRIFEKVPTISNLPEFRGDIAQKLNSKMLKNQSFKALLDIGIETYLWTLDKGEISVNLAFSDNREIKFNLLNYLFSTKDEGVNIIGQESIENFYRKALNLKPTQFTYLYMPSYHFKAVLEPEEQDQFYYVLNPELLADRVMYDPKNDYLSGFRIDIKGSLQSNDPSWKLLKKLEHMEYKLNSGAGQGNSFQISEEELKLEERRMVSFGSNRLPTEESSNLRKGPWAITSSTLGRTSLHNDDFVHSLYFLDNLHYGPGIINLVDQKNTHVALFMKYFLYKKAEQVSHFERFTDAYLQVQLNAREDKYWNGWKPYTNVLIKKE